MSHSLPVRSNEVKTRRPPSNVRHEGKTNKMTKVGKSGIFYSDDKVIGRGATSIVYKGHFNNEEKRAAVKRVFSKSAEVCKTEIDIWLKVNDSVLKKENVNVVQLFHWTKFWEGKAENYYFAMERADFSLNGWLNKIKEKDDPDWRSKAMRYMKDTVNGLNWLHSKRVIHRDIKPDNILIFAGGDDGKGVAKLGDFGISKLISGLSTGTNSDGKGTTDWMAPEAIHALCRDEQLHSTRALDIFSLGLTAHYAFSKGSAHPFGFSAKSGKLITVNILSPDIPPAVLGNEEYAGDHLFQWMMAHMPTERPKIRQVRYHPFFWSSIKQLGFILDVAKSLDHKWDDDIKKCKELLDSFYLERDPNWDWISVLGQDYSRLTSRRNITKSRKISTPYDGKCLSSLIKLIRDKDVHNADLVDELISEAYFGRMTQDGKWIYCEEKYAQFFLTRFPDLLIFLFVFLVVNEDVAKLKTVESVKWKYKMKEFNEKIPVVPSYHKNMVELIHSTS